MKKIVCTALLCCSEALAADTCDISLDDIFDEPAVASPESIQASQAQELRALPANTGLGSGTLGGNLTDFIPLLSVTGLGNGLTGDNVSEDGDSIAVDFNYDFGAEAGQVKLQAAFAREPAVDSALLDSVDSDIREALQSESNDLGLGDDATFSLIYSFGIGGLGQRSLESLNSLVLATFAAQSVEVDQTLQETVRVLASSANNFREVMAITGTATPFSALTFEREEDRTALCAIAREFQMEVQKSYRAQEAAFEALGLAELINNRDQLLLKTSYRDRDALVGPDETSLSLSYEWGFQVTASDMQTYGLRFCSEDEKSCLLKHYSDFARNNREAISSQNRLKLSLEYVDVEDHEYSNQLAGVNYAREGSTKRIAALGYGRALNRQLLDYSRLDAEIRYEDVEDDPARNDRFIGSLTLSTRVAKGSGWTIPFTLIYSNRPEYVENTVDDKFSAHIGIRWDMHVK